MEEKNQELAKKRNSKEVEKEAGISIEEVKDENKAPEKVSGILFKIDSKEESRRNKKSKKRRKLKKIEERSNLVTIHSSHRGEG